MKLVLYICTSSINELFIKSFLLFVFIIYLSQTFSFGSTFQLFWWMKILVICYQMQSEAPHIQGEKATPANMHNINLVIILFKRCILMYVQVTYFNCDLFIYLFSFFCHFFCTSFIEFLTV